MNQPFRPGSPSRTTRCLLAMAMGLVCGGALAQAPNPVQGTVPVERPAVSASQPAAALGVAAQQEARCRAQWAAYAQSQRCFSACGAPARGGARNNAACSDCADTPMPTCPEPR